MRNRAEATSQRGKLAWAHDSFELTKRWLSWNARRGYLLKVGRALSRRRRSRETSGRDKMNDGGPELGLKAKGK